MGALWKSSSRGLALAVLALAASIGTASTAQASTASEERDGARILRGVENGDRDCGQLSSSDLENVGDYVMGRMVGSTAAHEQMDSLMKSMMGGTETEQMHVVMGKRFTGCRRGQVPSGFGAMMGAMGMMGGGGGSGMMGRNYDDGNQGSMMGGLRSTTNAGNGDDIGAVGWVMVAMMGLLLALAGGALWFLRPSRRASSHVSALDTLRERYARGEIDGDEFERRRRALGGTT